MDSLLFAVLYNFIIGKQNVDLGIVTVSPYVMSFIIKFPIATLSGFWVMNNVAFPGAESGNLAKVSRYYTVVVANLLLGYFGLKLLVEQLHLYPTLSNMTMFLATGVFSYFMQKKFTFREHRAFDHRFTRQRLRNRLQPPGQSPGP